MSETGNQCYAWRTEQHYTNARRLVERNTLALETATTVAEKTVLYEKAVLDYKIDHEKAQKRVSWPLPKVYRHFWDGDMKTKEDARAIRVVCVKHSDVQFWQYSRSFQFVPFLLGPPNLAVYLSVDRYNLEAAKVCKTDNPSVKLAFCGDDWAETENLALEFPNERKGPRCPELTKRIPLVVDKGGGYGEGACVSCGLCLYGRNNVRFSSKH